MKTFLEYLDKKNRQIKEKLEKISDLLKRIDKFMVMSFLEKEEESYLFVRFPVDSPIREKLEDLKLGIRIFIIGNKMVYRLQQGPKGIQIGPSKTIESQEEIEDLVAKGKKEDEAYNQVMRELPSELRTYMKKVYKNIESKADSRRQDKDLDEEKYKSILHSIVNVEFDPSFKM